MKLNVLACGLACSLIWGVGLFLGTWWMMAFDGATGEPTIIGKFYRGYNLSLVGSLIGLVWALVDGFVGGAIFAWLYNVIATRGAKNEPA